MNHSKPIIRLIPIPPWVAPMSDDPETALIKEVALGDRQSFKLLFVRYEKPLLAYMMKTLGDRQVAEEMVNDVMFEVWKQARLFRGNSRLSTWIFGIAHNKALNQLRRKGRRNVVGLEAVEDIANGQKSPQQLAEERDVRERIKSAIEELPPQQREVVELTFYHGFSYEEIARILKCPAGTVKTRMFYARQRLREVLAGVELGG